MPCCSGLRAARESSSRGRCHGGGLVRTYDAGDCAMANSCQVALDLRSSGRGVNDEGTERLEDKKDAAARTTCLQLWGG